MKNYTRIISLAVSLFVSAGPLWAMEEVSDKTASVQRKIKKGKVMTQYGELFYRDSGGEGPVGLCLHGNSTSNRLFKRLMRENPDMRFIAFDAPGHRHSFRASELDAEKVYSFPGCATAYLQGLDELKIERVACLLGISKGGHEAIHVYAQAPSRFDSLVTSGTPYLPLFTDQDHMGRVLGTAFKPHSAGALSGKGEAFTFEDAVLYLTANGLKPDDSKWIEIARGTDGQARALMFKSALANQRVDEVETLRTASIPVLCLGGANDAFVNYEYVQGLGLPSHIEIQVVEGEDHSFVWNNPQLFSQLMKAHLGKLSKLQSDL